MRSKEEVTEKTATGKKKVIYSCHADSDNRSWMSFDEIGKIEGVTKNRASTIFNGAMKKLARHVFLEIRERCPTEKELEELSKNEDFQFAVSDELMKSSVDRLDP